MFWLAATNCRDIERVGIARALAIDPSVLLSEEPFGAFDVADPRDHEISLADIWQTTKKAVLVITHDIREAVL